MKLFLCLVAGIIILSGLPVYAEPSVSPAVSTSPSAVPLASPFTDPDLGYTKIKDTLPVSKFDQSSLTEIGSEILRVLNTIIAVLAFFGLIISGVMMITAGGDPEKAEKAKKNIVWVITGIVIYLLSLYILPVTRGIIENNFIKEMERQQQIDIINQIQAMILSAFMLGK